MAEPLRTCVACGQKQEKKVLLRYVWGEGEPLLDEQGVAPGRGAYCCMTESCQKRFIKQNKKWKRVFRL